MSYHIDIIPRGVYGEVSKIVEETLELQDAANQNAELMVLNELSDIIGAIEGYLQRYHPSITMTDLVKMKDLTARAFASGHRRDKEALSPPTEDSKVTITSGGGKVTITAEMVTALRDATDCPMMQCRKALFMANGDMKRAEEILRYESRNLA